MNKHELKAPSGRPIGTIITDSSGKQVLRLPNGQDVGRYDPKSNKTYLPSGAPVGTGNLLTTLLPRGS